MYNKVKQGCLSYICISENRRANGKYYTHEIERLFELIAAHNNVVFSKTCQILTRIL